MTPAPHITFILNPAAGRGKAAQIEAALQSVIHQAPFTTEYFRTTGPGHATELARTAAISSSIVVAVGGDGTVNEVATGLIGSSCALAVLSEGSGNDFARIVNAPDNPAALIPLLSYPTIKKFDTGSVRLHHDDGSITERKFFNSIGLGFDAAVAKKVSTIRRLRGIPLYLSALLRTIAGYKPHLFSITSNGRTWSNSYFLICVGNGQWEGGGFKLTPNARPDDGIFEVCGVAGNSVLTVLPILPFVMNGTHTGKKHIEIFNTSALTIESDAGFPIHGDGEIFGWKLKKAEISMIPASLNVVLREQRS